MIDAIEGERSKRAMAQANGEALFEQVYREDLDQFCSVVAAIVRDRDAAPDIVQEAFASALRAHRQVRRPESVRAWVWKIVLNAANDHLRSRRCTLPLTEECHAERGDEGDQLSDEVAAGIQSLPERQRLAIFLRYYADLEYREIASIIGVATGTVSATISAAHATLKRRLREVPR